MSGDRDLLMAAERRRLTPSRYGRLRIALGYPNSYRVAQSSLAFQWVLEIAARQPDVAVERFFADPGLSGRSFESGAPLADFDVVAWSHAFELDAPNLLRVLDAAGIPRRRCDRGPRWPLLVIGGPVASINPLPLAAMADVFVLGAAERLWPPLIEAVAELDRGSLLADLARREGYFVPSHHLDSDQKPSRRLRRVEKRDVQMTDPHLIPFSHIVTPHTEYSRRGLVEMSRGCPEKCRYCWVSHNYGRLRCYPADGILDRIRELRPLTDRIGFIATAIGDHPNLPEILTECRALDINVALSSIRIPAVVPDVLIPLGESGATSITIAPETGSDALRRQLNKPVTNTRILEAVETAQRCGIPNLKMYFILGLPGESDEDVRQIADLIESSLEIMLSWGRHRGRLGSLHVGVNLLIPKPYTPYQREPMLDPRQAKHRLDLLWSRLKRLDNVTCHRPSYRESLWQAFLSRADCSAFRLIEQLVDGERLGRLIARHRTAIENATLTRVEGDPIWQFFSSAPVTPTTEDRNNQAG